MMKLICATLMLGCLGLASPGRLVAQERDDDGGGIGGILDWIHKLSGPGFVGPGIAPFYETNHQKLVFRLTVMMKWSIFESKAGLSNDDNITMLTIQPSVEHAIGDGSVGLGFAFLRFGGDVTPFWHYSVPILAQWRPRTDDDLAPRAGAVIEILPRFGPTDFAPLQQVTVRRDRWEPVFHLFAGADYRFR